MPPSGADLGFRKGLTQGTNLSCESVQSMLELACVPPPRKLDATILQFREIFTFICLQIIYVLPFSSAAFVNEKFGWVQTTNVLSQLYLN